MSDRESHQQYGRKGKEYTEDGVWETYLSDQSTFPSQYVELGPVDGTDELPERYQRVCAEIKETSFG